MKALKYIFQILLFGISFNSFAQTLHGTVQTPKGELLEGATVRWADMKNVGTTTDSLGNFSLKTRPAKATLLITYVGYPELEVEVEPHERKLLIEVIGEVELQGVTVSGHASSNFVSTLENRHLETVTSCELRNAPCCNLSEAFETNGSVDVTYNDAITGASEIQMLGLRGIYSSLQIENRPSFYGIGTPYALDFIPGTWLDKIQISKGASTVLNGFQSITGQINAELVKPNKDKPVFVNGFGNTMGRAELNVHLNKKLSKEWSGGALLHGSIFQNQIDHDNDGFLNMPLKKQLNGMLRLVHNSKDWHFESNLHQVLDERIGGQVIPQNSNASNYWRMLLNSNRTELFGKLAYLGFSKPYNNLGFQYSVLQHQADGYYGKTLYNGKQKSLYANLLYSTIISDTDHKLTFGSSFQTDDYVEKLDETTYKRTEIIPGAFGEYTYTHSQAGKSYVPFSLIAGVRIDYHNLYDLLITPRVNAKYNFSENTVIRASLGRGYHSPNIIPENIGLLASNRKLEYRSPLTMEDAWNTGVNFSTNIHLFHKDLSLSADVFRTVFTNQMVIDVDQDYSKIIVYQLVGKSFANSVFLTVSYPLFSFMDVRVAYKFNDVQTQFATGQIEQQPLVAKHRGLITMNFKTKNEKWLFNITSQFVGKQRFPKNKGIPVVYHRHETYSDPYMQLMAQVTRKFKNWEVYVGGENLTNYTQHQPIIAANEPFSPYFNASQIYGPLMGARGYFGFRYFID